MIKFEAAYTLVEILVITAIIGILAAASIPSITESLARNRMTRAAEEIYGLILQAKSDGMLRSLEMSFHSRSSTVPWCVGYSATSSCDCTLPDTCTVNVSGSDVIQTLNGTSYPGVSITSNLFNESTTFNAIRGTASQGGSIAVRSGDWQLNIVVSNQGRIRLCNPHHRNHTIAGYGPC